MRQSEIKSVSGVGPHYVMVSWTDALLCEVINYAFQMSRLAVSLLFHTVLNRSLQKNILTRQSGRWHRWLKMLMICALNYQTQDIAGQLVTAGGRWW